MPDPLVLRLYVDGGSEGVATAIIGPPGRAGLTEMTIQPIELFSDDIVGDGVANDSAAVKAAHDAAYTAGLREVYCGQQYNVPSLGAVGNVIFRGPGALIGHSTAPAARKKIIPLSAGSHTIPNEVTIGNLATFAAAASPKIAMMGDSVFLPWYLANEQNNVDTLEARIREKIIRDVPSKTLTFFNFSIGATTWTHAKTKPPASGISYPSWYTDTASGLWLSYIETFAPDLLILNFGTNDSTAFNAADMLNVVAQINAWSKVPSLIFVTPFQFSNMYTPAQETSQQFGRDYVAGYIRTYARRKGYGLLDMHRQSVLMRDGFDIENPEFKGQVIASVGPGSGAQLAPYTFAQACTDYSIEMSFNYGAGNWFGSGSKMRFNLAYNGASYLDIYESAGKMAAQLAGVVTETAVVSASGWPAVPILQVTKKSGRLAVSVRSNAAPGGDVTNILDAYYPIHGGEHIPTITKQGGNSWNAFGVSYLQVGQPRLYVPQLTDIEMWGSVGGVYAGNGANHISSRGIAAIVAPVVERARFAN